jgi:hypothetical protein
MPPSWWSRSAARARASASRARFGLPSAGFGFGLATIRQLRLGPPERRLALFAADPASFELDQPSARMARLGSQRPPPIPVRRAAQRRCLGRGDHVFEASWPGWRARAPEPRASATSPRCRRRRARSLLAVGGQRRRTSDDSLDAGPRTVTRPAHLDHHRLRVLLDHDSFQTTTALEEHLVGRQLAGRAKTRRLSNRFMR